MRILKRCKKADILGPDGNVVCRATVKASNEDYLLLTVPEDFDYVEQNHYNILFYDPDLGLLTCQCLLTLQKKLPNQMRSLRCKIVQRLSQEQRRMDLKIPLDTMVYVRLLGRGGGEIPATIGNISAGGVYLQSTLQAGVGDRFLFFFSETGENMALTAEVLRVVSPCLQEEPIIYGYGCKFVDLSLGHEEQLRNFVFQRDYQNRTSMR